MFGADDEDEDFLTPTGGAKLASLFGVDQQVSQTNESFQYTAPKQPRKSSATASVAQKSAPPPGAPAVLFGTAVQAFRYINGQYVKQGKLGLAVLGNYTTKEFTLLLYLSQQKQVTAAKIHMGFILTVQPNSYCTFYDDQRQNWSMMFDSEKALSDFCKEICLAKANNPVSLDAVVIQDLSLGDGQAVKNGDTIELLYTGWLLQNHTTGEMFDSNHNTGKLMRLKLGAGKAIKGLEDGMLGMKKSGRRLLIIPPSLAYGSKGVANHALANSTLIFEAEICRVKFFRDSEPDHSNSVESTAPSPAPAPGPAPAPSPAPSLSSLSTEPPIQPTTLRPDLPGQPQHCENPHLLSEQPTNPDATKAKLISRMAKMGQPMFPFLKEAASHPESSDSEVEDVSNNRLKNQLTTPSPVHISTSAPATAHSVPAVVSASLNVPSQPGMFGSSHAFQAYPYAPLITSSQLHPAGPIHPVQTIPYMGDVTSFLMTEARQHNTEIRQSIGKVADKVDQLTSKMDILERQGSLFMSSSSVSMETSVIMHNIQRIVKENECLKREILEKSSCIEKQNCKITELITQNQRYMEQSDLILENRNNFLKSSNEQCQARLLEAEQEKSRLMEDLVSSKAQLSQLRLEASVQTQKAAELHTKLTSAVGSSEQQSQKVADLETQLKEAVGAAELSKAQHRLEKQRCEEMESRVHKMEEELQKLQTDRERLQQVALQEKESVQTRGDQQHGEELAKAAAERDALQDKLAQLQDKYTVSEQQWIAAKKKLERKMVELENNVAQQQTSGDATAKVKQVMNGVFHSLRGEFDVSETYSGQAVMEVIFSTIKNVTLQLLTGSKSSSPSENGQEKDKGNDGKHLEDASHENMTTENESGMKEESSMKITKEEMDRKVESKVNVQETAAPEPQQQQQDEKAAYHDISPGESSADSENPDKSKSDLIVHNELVGEVNASSSTSFTPPPNPPPNPPHQNEALEDLESCTRLTGEVCDNKEVSPPSGPSKEAEDDEMSLKGRPPSASMFGDDEDDNGVGWLD